MVERVVITGLGIVSSIGNDTETVCSALRTGKSGISINQDFVEKGLQSQVSGHIEIDLQQRIPRKLRRFMSNSAAFAYCAAEQAIEDAQLSLQKVSHPRTGLVASTSAVASSDQILATGEYFANGSTRISPYLAAKAMSNSVSAVLSSAFSIRGMSYGLSASCATGSHCIGNAYEQIQLGKQDVMLAGGAEEEHWVVAASFDAMGALTRSKSDQPSTLSRPFGKDRNGFVISGGAGIVVLESLSHAKARHAPIYAELIGFGTSADGEHMVTPNGTGAQLCMRRALGENRQVDYINAHATSTPIGDAIEAQAIRAVFAEQLPLVSSTKSLTGHGLGAAGAQELIYSLLMMQGQFIAPGIVGSDLDEDFADLPIVTQLQTSRPMSRVLSNSFGFGGTNVSLLVQHFDEST